jgi:hypothetical protein
MKAPKPPAPLAQCEVLCECSGLGKQAIKKEHRELLPNTIQYSSNFEQAVALWKADPDLKRWDYLVHSQRHQAWAAVEVHQAHAKGLLQKKRDSETILKQHCPAMLASIRSWHACIKGEIHPTQRRQLADTSIHISRNLLDVL